MCFFSVENVLSTGLEVARCVRLLRLVGRERVGVLPRCVSVFACLTGGLLRDGEDRQQAKR